MSSQAQRAICSFFGVRSELEPQHKASSPALRTVSSLLSELLLDAPILVAIAQNADGNLRAAALAFLDDIHRRFAFERVAGVPLARYEAPKHPDLAVVDSVVALHHHAQHSFAGRILARRRFRFRFRSRRRRVA